MVWINLPDSMLFATPPIRRHPLCRIDQVPQLLRRLEEWNFLRRNLNLRTRLRIPPHPGISLTSPETPKPANLDLIPGLQSPDHRIEEEIDDDLAVAAREVPKCGHLVD